MFKSDSIWVCPFIKVTWRKTIPHPSQIYVAFSQRARENLQDGISEVLIHSSKSESASFLLPVGEDLSLAAVIWPTKFLVVVF